MNFFDFSFWQQFVSNALATFLGAGLGVWGALWLSKYQSQVSEKERTKKILSVIGDEVLHNWAIIDSWIEDPRSSNVWILFSQLKSESWKALKDGGDLEQIKDPYLIKDLAEAYSYVHSLSLMSQKYFDLLYLSGDNASGVALSGMWDNIIGKASEASKFKMKLTMDFGTVYGKDLFGPPEEDVDFDI